MASNGWIDRTLCGCNRWQIYQDAFTEALASGSEVFLCRALRGGKGEVNISFGGDYGLFDEVKRFLDENLTDDLRVSAVCPEYLFRRHISFIACCISRAGFQLGLRSMAARAGICAAIYLVHRKIKRWCTGYAQRFGDVRTNADWLQPEQQREYLHLSGEDYWCQGWLTDLVLICEPQA